MEDLVVAMQIQGFYQGKKVLVTGHTGFKGAWLLEWLLMMGAKVTGLALPPPTDPALFDQLGFAGRCDHRIGDIRDRALVKKLIHEIRPDLIFHLAAQPIVRFSYAQPIETYETNVMGTAHVLDALRDADWPCAAVMITTDKVYDNKEIEHAYRETDPLGGYDPYSSSKACAELVIQSYRNSFFNPERIGGRRSAVRGQKSEVGSQDTSRLTSHLSPPLVGVASARAGNVIGGGDWAQDRIVPDCMRALAKGEAIIVRNPHATRPWQHVLEPLSGYLLLGERLYAAVRSEAGGQRSEIRDPRSEIEGRGPAAGTICPPTSALRSPPSGLVALATSFNFGPALASNRPVRELVEEVLKHWPGRWEDRGDPHAVHEASLLNLSTDKARQVLGWVPLWGFARTLEATVEWYRAVHAKGPGVASELVRGQIAAYASGKS